jgi:Rrf2 family protein
VTGEFAVAVHALVYLDKCGGARDSEALAANVCTNPARIRKVMARLRRAGLVEAKPGAEGGYRFCLEASRLTLREIAEALEETPVSPSWRPGNPDLPCAVASGMAGAMDAVYAELNRACMDRLSGITLEMIEARLSGGKPCGHVEGA